MTIQSDPVPSDRCEKCGRYEKASIEQCFIGDKDCPRLPTLAPTRETAPALSDEAIISLTPGEIKRYAPWVQEPWVNFARAVLKAQADREQRPAALSEAVPHRSFSEKTMKDHDDLVRAAASHKAWLDLLERFSPKQRRDLAMLMAHNWTISAIEIQTFLNSSGKSDKRYDAETTVAQLFPNGSLKPRASGAARERAITGEPVAWFVDAHQGSDSAVFANWVEVCPGDRLWSDEWTRYELRAAPITGEPVAACWYCGSADVSCQKPFNDVPCRRAAPISRDVAAESDKA